MNKKKTTHPESGLSDYELEIEKIVDKIKALPTIEGIALLKNYNIQNFALRFWIQCNIDECASYVPKLAKKKEYKDCIELEGMIKAYKKVLLKMTK